MAGFLRGGLVSHSIEGGKRVVEGGIGKNLCVCSTRLRALESSVEQYAIAATRKNSRAQFAGSRRARGPKNALAGCQWLGKDKARQTQRFLYTLARTRVWDPAGILPQRGQVVERPRLAPRRLQRRRRRRLVGAEPDRDAREADRGEQLELH